MRNVPHILLMLALVLSLAGCNETQEANYATCADAVRDGAFQHGWLPDVLQPDSTDIQERHDLDTNVGRATFTFTKQLTERLERNCAHFAANERVTSPFSSWPEFLRERSTAAELESRNIKAYRCERFTIAVDSSKGMGFLWH